MSPSKSALPSHWEELDTLSRWGFPIPLHRRKCTSIDEVITYHHETETMRDSLPYEIDGIVVKVDRRDWQEQLGFKSRSPRWAVAYKFTPRQEITVVENIVASVGRTGTLTVITSYSIHYTKLYESWLDGAWTFAVKNKSHCVGPGLNGNSRILNVRDATYFRITSYNVCYTKLLRRASWKCTFIQTRL